MTAVRLVTKPPAWLVVASALVLGQIAVLAVSQSMTIGALAFAINLFILLFLLKGSRIAWTLIFLGIAIQIVEGVVAGSYASSGIAMVMLICLLTPRSIQYVWHGRAASAPATGEPGGESFSGRIRLSASRTFFPIAGWTYAPGKKPESRRSYAVLLWRLGGFTLLFLFSYALLWNWEHGSAHDVFIVHVLAVICRVAWVISLLVFIGAMVLATFRHLAHHVRGSNSARCL